MNEAIEELLLKQPQPRELSTRFNKSAHFSSLYFFVVSSVIGYTGQCSVVLQYERIIISQSQFDDLDTH